ncbi:hypothetical protein [Enterobacter cloacae]|uniref:hypothetical protein n=1 Tax=Enterobacter cloacae TaxID=550 RepID=UPI001EE5425A|nr:hypothetical protein [Enterobacter cloacae]UKW21260.1 hypothetical protein MBA36_05580 [Enterobacter cloacae]
MKLLTYIKSMPSMQVMSILSCFLASTIFEVAVFALPTKGILIYNILAFSFVCSIYVFLNKNFLKSVAKPSDSILPIALGILCLFISLSMYDSYISQYFSFSPVFDVDSNNIWHQDTSFNVSIIQSIITFGYPSVGLDGHRLTAYHVLTHYFDAALLIVSGLDPYNSYGMTSLTKASLFVCLCLVLCQSITAGKFRICALFLVASPLIISSWHSVVSHALWMPSILLLITSIFTYRFVYQTEPPTIKSYISLSFLSILLCLGKISTGLTYIMIVFSISFFRDYCKARMYVSAFFLIIFIFAYQKFINYSYGIDSSISLDGLGLTGVFNLIYTSGIKYASVIPVIISLMGVIFYSLRNRSTLRVVFGMTATFLLVCALSIMMKSFSWSDKFYFFQGVYATSVLIFIIALSNIPRVIPTDFSNIGFALSLMTLSFLSFFVYQPLLSFPEVSLKRIENKIKYIKSEKIKKAGDISNGNLSSLVSYIENVRNDTGINKSSLAIFIPKNVIQSEFENSNDNRRSNFYTMNIYASTGIQIIRGVIGNERAYGFANYKDDSRLVNSIDYAEACSFYNVSGIITITSYINKKYKYHKC